METLDLTGMDIDTVEREFPTLKANYGAGYGDAAILTGNGGMHRWSISSGCLPGDASYGSLIGSETRLDYYWDFFKRHTTGADDIFVISFRGHTYHAGFVEVEVQFEMFTYDLFGGPGILIEQRRAEATDYNDDGTIDFSYILFEADDVVFSAEGSATSPPVYM